MAKECGTSGTDSIFPSLFLFIIANLRTQMRQLNFNKQNTDQDFGAYDDGMSDFFFMIPGSRVKDYNKYNERHKNPDEAHTCLVQPFLTKHSTGLDKTYELRPGFYDVLSRMAIFT